MIVVNGVPLMTGTGTSRTGPGTKSLIKRVVRVSSCNSFVAVARDEGRRYWFEYKEGMDLKSNRAFLLELVKSVIIPQIRRCC